MSVEEALKEFQKLNRQITQLLNLLGYECDNVVYDREDLDEEFLRSQIYYLSNKLGDIKNRVEYLSKPIKEQGFISKNSLGRYELPSGYYFTSGSICEILWNDDRNDEQYWLYTTIEHNGTDYYATALGKQVSIDGMMVRIR